MRFEFSAVIVAMVLTLNCTTSPTSPSSADEVEATITAAVEATVAALPPSPSSTTRVPQAATPVMPTISPPDVDGNLIANVERVVDGDTVEVSFLSGALETARPLGLGTTETVRLLGVDTPETYSVNKPGEYGNITDTGCLDRWGDLATEFAVQTLDQQPVNLVLDPDAGLRGYYGRLLAYVLVSDQDFNAKLVELGYARVYTEGSSSREADYLNLQEQAQAQRIGLWKCESVSSLSTPISKPGTALTPVAATNGPTEDCDPAYPDVCIPSPPPDLDCGEIAFTNFTVLSPDPHRLDGDRDGVGCEG